MTQDEHDELEVLKFELKFIENDGLRAFYAHALASSRSSPS